MHTPPAYSLTSTRTRAPRLPWKGIFVLVNFEEDKRSAQSEVNEDKALMRHEFLEAIVRMAVKKHSREIPDVSDCVNKFLVDMMTHADPVAKIDADIFRRERLYREEVEQVYVEHMFPLQVSLVEETRRWHICATNGRCPPDRHAADDLRKVQLFEPGGG